MQQIATMTYDDLNSISPTGPIGRFYAYTLRQEIDEDLPGLNVRIHGTRVHLTIVPDSVQGDVILAEAELFIPEPQS